LLLIEYNNALFSIRNNLIQFTIILIPATIKLNSSRIDELDSWCLKVGGAGSDHKGKKEESMAIL